MPSAAWLLGADPAGGAGRGLRGSTRPLNAERARLRATDEQVPQALVRLPSDGHRRSAPAAAGSNSDQEVPCRPAGQRAVRPQLRRVHRAAAVPRRPDDRRRCAAPKTPCAPSGHSWSRLEQTVLLNAATAYSDVYRDQAVLELNIRNEQRLARQLEATRDRFQVGEVTRTDVSQAEARLARATLPSASAPKAISPRPRAMFRNVVGRMPPASAAAAAAGRTAGQPRRCQQHRPRLEPRRHRRRVPGTQRA